MNKRLVRATLAISSVLIASIVTGGMMVFVGGLLYRRLAETASPLIALYVLIASALTLGVVVVLLGQVALQRAILPSRDEAKESRTLDELIASELVRLANGNPAKLLFASLGIGFALDLSPRLRRAVSQSFSIKLPSKCSLERKKRPSYEGRPFFRTGPARLFCQGLNLFCIPRAVKHHEVSPAY